MALIKALAFCSVLAVVNLYKIGPPVNEPGLCVSMFPVGHNVSRQTDPAPYDIVADKSCYRSGDVLNVEVKVKDQYKGDEAYFFEGFFLQARPEKGNDYDTTSIGTFHNSENDTEIQTLRCFDRDHSAMGHSEAHHYFTKKFSWKAPDVKSAFVFHATVVRETEQIWMNVRTKKITHCDQDSSGSNGTLSSLFVASLMSLIAVFFRM